MYLYAVEIVDVCVKVGITARPRVRMSQHKSNAQNHGRQIGRTYLSTDHVEAQANEAVLIDKYSSKNRNEYLKADFDDILADIQSLPQTAATHHRDPFRPAQLEGNNQLISVTDAAKILGVTRSSVYGMIQMGDLGVINLSLNGIRPLFRLRLASVEALAKHRTTRA